MLSCGYCENETKLYNWKKRKKDLYLDLEPDEEKKANFRKF